MAPFQGIQPNGWNLTKSRNVEMEKLSYLATEEGDCWTIYTDSNTVVSLSADS
jgi:hypothetical protein